MNWGGEDALILIVFISRTMISCVPRFIPPRFAPVNSYVPFNRAPVNSYVPFNRAPGKELSRVKTTVRLT